MPRLHSASRPPRTARHVGALAALAIVVASAALPGAAVAAVDTPLTFDQPAAATSGVVQYPASGATVTTLTGTGPAGATVRIETVEGATLSITYPCTTTVIASTWSCDVTFGSFIGTVTAQRMVDSGGVSLPAEQILHTVVALTPPAFDPSSTAVVSASTSATITGTATPPLGTTTATVRLTVEGDEICVTAVSLAGAWSCSASLAGAADGPLDLAITQTRSAGGTSGTSLAAATTYTLDRTGPTTAGAFTTPASSTLNVSQNTFALAGTAEASASVTVKAGATTLCGPVTATLLGAWSCTATTPADGAYTMTIAQADALGNTGTGGSESIALTVARPSAPIVITPPSIYIAPPPVFITLPVPVIQAPTEFITITPAEFAIAVGEGPLVVPAQRVVMTEIVVTSFQQFVIDTNSSQYFVSQPVTDIPMQFDLSLLYRDMFPLVESNTPADPAAAPVIDWDNMPGNFAALLFMAPSGSLITDVFGTRIDAVPQQSISAFTARAVSELPAGSRLLDQQPIDANGEVVLSGVIPDDVEPGEYDLIVRIEAEGMPDIEPIDVGTAITVVAAESTSADPGVSPWLWAGLAALVLGIVAIIVMMARSARRRA